MIEKRQLFAPQAENLVILSDEKHSFLAGWLTAAIEYGVLNRYTIFGYKNSARANMRIFAALFLTLFLVLVFALLNRLCGGSECAPSSTAPAGQVPLVNHPVAIFLGVLISAFIIERKTLYEKWTYLAGLYNSLLKEDPMAPRYEPMRIALAIDLLDMEMWSHRSFRASFYDALLTAMEYDQGFTGAGRLSVFPPDDLGVKAMPRDLARALLSKYHESTM